MPSAQKKALLIFCFLCCAYFMVSFQRLCLGTIAPDIAAALAFGPVALGWLGSGFHYSYALCQIPGGYVIDRYGPRIPLSLLFGLIGGMGSCLFAVSASFGSSILARILVGVGMSIVTASSFKTISSLFSSRRYIRFISIFFAVGGFGMLFSTSPLAFINKVWGWRNLFLISGLICLALGAAFWFLLKEHGPAPSSEKTSSSDKSFKALVGALFSLAPFRVILLWYITASSIFFSFASLWAGPYYGAVFGLSSEEVGQLLSVGILGLIIGTPVGAWLSEKIGSRKRVIILSSILAVTGSAMICFLGSGAGTAAACLSFVLICLSGNLGASVIYALLKDSIPAHLVGTSTALMSSSLFVLTAMLQMIIGYLLTLLSSAQGQLPYEKGFLIYLALGLISLMLSFRLADVPSAKA